MGVRVCGARGDLVPARRILPRWSWKALGAFGFDLNVWGKFGRVLVESKGLRLKTVVEEGNFELVRVCVWWGTPSAFETI